MEKTLGVKTQSIVPNVDATTRVLASTLELIPEESLLLQKHGTLYLIYTLETPTPFDKAIVSKMVKDVIYDDYFQADTPSPAQAVEKAIIKLRDSLTAALTQAEPQLSFHATAAVLWGETLYIVQYGDAKVFLIREGVIKEVEAATEGKFSISSGIVKNDDVVLMTTPQFAKTYPPESLLANSALAASTLQPNECAQIIKFEIASEFTEQERIAFDQPVQPDSTTDTAKDIPKLTQQTNEATAQETPVEAIHQQPSMLEKIKPVVATTKFKLNNKTLILSLSGLVLTIGLLGLSKTGFKFQSVKTTTNQTSMPEQQPRTQLTQPTIPASPKATPQEDEKNKVRRVSSNILYDIKIAEPTADTNQIAVLNDTLIVYDQLGKFFISDIDIPKFTPLQKAYPDVTNLMPYGNNVAYTTPTGFNVLNVKTESLEKAYPQPGLGPTTTYLDYVYSISGDTLTRYTKEDTALVPTVWGKASDFETTVAFTIDVSIYLAQKNGQVVKYTSGQKDTFDVTGLPQPLTTIKKIITTPDFKNIYIADTEHKAIVVIDKTGTYLYQIKLEHETGWDDIRDITITQDEKRLFVLAKTKVYEVKL